MFILVQQPGQFWAYGLWLNPEPIGPYCESPLDPKGEQCCGKVPYWRTQSLEPMGMVEDNCGSCTAKWLKSEVLKGSFISVHEYEPPNPENMLVDWTYLNNFVKED